MQSLRVLWVAGLLGLLTISAGNAESGTFGSNVKPVAPVEGNAPTVLGPGSGNSQQTVPGEKLIYGADAAAIYMVAQNWGSASLQITGSDNPKISGKIAGMPYTIYFYDCGETYDSCMSIQFVTLWRDTEASLERINDWNSNRRWPVASRYDTDTVRTHLDAIFVGGVTSDNIDEWFNWWDMGLRGFRDYLYD